jgi:hypothetical protein
MDPTYDVVCKKNDHNYGPLIVQRPSPSCVQETPTIKMTVLEETVSDAEYISQVALVCRYNGFCPNLPNLHSWIKEN